MQVSIIIVNYNTFKLTCDCIQSIIDKTEGVTYEIILIDNASVECAPQLFKQKFPDIHLISSNTNIGFAGANNLGLQIAKGNYLLLLNNDTILMENCIFLSLKKMQELKNIGFLGVKCIFPNGEVQDTCSHFPTIKNVLTDLLFLNYILPKEKNYYNLNKSFYPDAIWGCYMLFKKELLLDFKNHKLDDSFFMYQEDLLWCWQSKKLNYKNYYYPDTKLIHIYGGSQKKSEIKEKMNSLKIENMRKLRVIVNGKVGVYFYYFFYAILRTRQVLKKQLAGSNRA